MNNEKTESRALLGAIVEWMEDYRPMPGDYGFSEELLSDMSLIYRETGRVEKVNRSPFGEWKALVNKDGEFIEKNVRDLRIIQPNGKDNQYE